LRPVLCFCVGLSLAACGGANTPSGGSFSHDNYSESWAASLRYRSVAAEELDSEGSTDTGAPLAEVLSLEVSDGGGGRLVVWSIGDDPAESIELSQMQLETDGLLAIRSVNGIAMEPEIVLLERNFSSGDVVQSGDWTASVEVLPELSTWYGSLDLVVEVSIEGPQGHSGPNLIRLAQDIGPVQLSWGDYAGDLAWYDP
jgi:hypothetical protein